MGVSPSFRSAAATASIPPSDQLALTYFDGTDQNAHTWWNPLTKREADKLADIAVQRGDTPSLVVGRRGHPFADSTAIELVIAERGGKTRTWDLAQDVVETIQAGDLHADSPGNADVWSFYRVEGSFPAPFGCGLRSAGREI